MYQPININPDENADYQRLIDTIFAINCRLTFTRYTVTFNGTPPTMLALRFGKRVIMTTNNVGHAADEMERRLEQRIRAEECHRKCGSNDCADCRHNDN